MKTAMVAACLLGFAAVACSTQGKEQARSEPAQSPVEFARQFYDWYVPLALGALHGPASDSALAARPNVFGPKLLAALQEDSKAQAAAAGSGMIDGLDFDPFLNAQDPCDRYVVGPATAHDGSWLVDVRGVGGCAAHETPDVVAELARQDTSWLFVDFRYPDSNDALLTVLARLHPEGATTSPAAGNLPAVDRDTAIALAQRFLRADLAGQMDSAWSLLHDCVVMPSADYLEPSLGARVMDATPAGDTVRVTARYVVLGRTDSEDPDRARTPGEYWHFQPNVRADTVVFPVVRAPSGKVVIDCGYFPPDHPLADSMAGEVAHMDTASREAWRRAVVEAGRIQSRRQPPATPESDDFEVLDTLQIGDVTVVLGQTPLDSVVAVLGGAIQKATDREYGDFACYVVGKGAEATYVLLGTNDFSEPPGRILVAQHSTWPPSAGSCDTAVPSVPVAFGQGLSLGLPKDSVSRVLGYPTPTTPGYLRSDRAFYGPYPGEVAFFSRSRSLYDDNGQYLTSLENPVTAVFDQGVLIGLIVGKVYAG